MKYYIKTISLMLSLPLALVWLYGYFKELLSDQWFTTPIIVTAFFIGVVWIMGIALHPLCDEE